MDIECDCYNSLKRDVVILGLSQVHWGMLLACLSSLFVLELILSFFVNTNSLIFFLGLPALYITAMYVRKKGNRIGDIMRIFAKNPREIKCSVLDVYWIMAKYHGEEK